MTSMIRLLVGVALAVFADTSNRGRGQFGSSRCVVSPQRGLVIRCGLGAAVLGEGATLVDRLSSERVVGNGARGLFDWLFGCKRVSSDLGAASAVRKRVSLKIHIERYKK